MNALCKVFSFHSLCRLFYRSTTRSLWCITRYGLINVLLYFQVTQVTANDDVRVIFFDIGQGSCALITFPKSDPLLVDCGSNAIVDGTMTVEDVKSQINAENYAPLGQHRRKLNVIISHPDTDHYNLVAKVTKGMSIGKIYLGGERVQYKENGFKAWLNDNNDKVQLKFDNEWHGPLKILDKNSEANVIVLTVNTKKTAYKNKCKGFKNQVSESNANSLVLSVTYGEFIVVFSADAVCSTLHSAITNESNILESTTILTSPHHGANTGGSNDQEWAAKTTPKYVVFQAGFRNKTHAHPRCEAVYPFFTVDINTEVPWHDFWCFNERGDPNYFNPDGKGITTAFYSTNISTNIIAVLKNYSFNPSIHCMDVRQPQIVDDNCNSNY